MQNLTKEQLKSAEINEKIYQIKCVAKINRNIIVTHIPGKSVSISIIDQKKNFEIDLTKPLVISLLCNAYMVALQHSPLALLAPTSPQ